MVELVNTSTLDALGLRSTQQLQATEAPTQELGQGDFMELMVTQLRNQDPFKPMENGDFIAQMAQFSTVSGIAELQESFSALSDSLVSNQALQAASLVGHSVLAPSNIGSLEAGGAISGSLEIPATSSNVSVSVYDQTGQLVRNLQLGQQGAGVTEFTWDGIMDNGQFAAPGSYFLAAEAEYDGQYAALETMIESQVENVTLDQSGGLLLGLSGGVTLDFSEIRQIL